MSVGDLNHCTFIGRLTRDPEIKTFQGGSKLASFSLAFTGESKKDNQSGEWVDTPCFLDCKAWDTDKGRKLATVIGDYVKKGHRIWVAGKLTLEKWEDKATGTSRQAHKLRVTDVILIEKRQDGGGNGNGGSRSQETASGPASQPDDEFVPF